MTLPFRRRHHDDESAHDRARATWSNAMLEPIEAADQAWLDAHLAGCGECRVEREAFLADRELLRSLRTNAPEPPRDLWARTAAAIEQEAARSARHGSRGLPLAERLRPRQARFPLGVMAGLLVVIVVVATSLAPHGGIQLVPTPGASSVALASTGVGPSPIVVRTATVGWLQGETDGSFRLLLADIDEVCPDVTSGCAPISDTTRTSLHFDARPQAIVGSPDSHQVVVVGNATGSSAGNVTVYAVRTAAPNPTATPVATPGQSPAASAGASPGVSPAPSALPSPAGQVVIAAGVTVLGETSYSADGTWLAFSARPLDGSTGPDLYVWKVGDPSATQVTTDHSTFFSGWFDGRILASRVVLPTLGGPTSSGDPGASTAPPIEAHPVSFLFDPATGLSQDLAAPDVWLPTVDPTGRFSTYWLGTVTPDVAGTGWVPATGRLVLDGWTAPLGPAPSAAPRASAQGSGSGAPGASHRPLPSANPGLTPTATPEPIGPAGTPVDLATGPVAAFDARFDPKGTRLAVWIADPTDPTVGTLQLVVLDHANGVVDPSVSPLPSEPALRGISIGEGRLAWVTPPGKDGRQSVVQVLAWSGNAFGQIETVPGGQLTLLR
jgi:hypothetical protein